jgi:4-aminobutyrate aminotransferase-like enzyme
LFYKYVGSGFGNGPFVELADGSVKYDFITGIGVHYFGHSHKDIILASVQGAIENTPMQGHLQQNYSSAKLIKILLEQSNKYQAGLKHVVLTSSGAMANENALKLAFHKRAPASRIFAFEKCFSGRTLGLSYVTDKAAYRQGLPKTLDVDYLPFFDEKDPKGSTKRCLDTMKKYFKRYPKQHAAFIFEPILGEAGSWAGDKDFFSEILTLAKNENISLISDEVQAFGRTSELYAFQYYGLDKFVDIVTIGKMSQVCATLFKEDHKPAPGLISQTFTSSSSAIHASLEVMNKITTENYLGPNGKINQLGDCFRKELINLSQKYPEKICGPYGVGAMVAMTVFNGDSKKSTDFTYKLFDAGVLSFTAGDMPTRIRFLMPIGAVEEKHIKEVAGIIEQTLKEMN